MTEGILLGFLTAFVVGFTTTLSQETEIDRRRIIYTVVVGFSLGFTMGLSLLFAKTFSDAFPVIIGMTIASTVGSPLGTPIGFWLRPRIVIYSNILLYLREMATYLIFFAVGYVALAALFAGWYWSIWKISPLDSFNQLSPNPNFWEFFYFSMVTIVTLGYGDITPKSEIARSLVIIESIVGIGWITVIFAAVLAHLQPRFSEIAKIQREQAEEDKREEARKNSTV